MICICGSLMWKGDRAHGWRSCPSRTVDRTPPKFNTNATVNKVERTSVGLYANLNEAGTLYWVVVEQGTEYPKPLAGQSGRWTCPVIRPRCRFLRG